MATYPLVIKPETIEGKTRVTIKTAITVARGDLLGYSSGWCLADADSGVAIYARWVALQDCVGDGTLTIDVCRECDFYNENATYTANTAQYLSGTTGGITETRPTAAGDLIQIAGWSMDTYNVHIRLEGPGDSFTWNA